MKKSPDYVLVQFLAPRRGSDAPHGPDKFGLIKPSCVPRRGLAETFQKRCPQGPLLPPFAPPARIASLASSPTQLHQLAPTYSPTL